MINAHPSKVEFETHNERDRGASCCVVTGQKTGQTPHIQNYSSAGRPPQRDIQYVHSRLE